MRLGYMCSDDARRALDLINERYRLPASPEVPDTLTLKYGFRRSVTFDAGGIHLLVRGEPREYLWGEMRRIHTTRMDPLRRDFNNLEIVLPEESIELKMITHQGGASPSWRGPTPEEVNEVLRRYSPDERIDVDIHGERPTKRIDIEDRLNEVKKKRRELRIIVCLFVPITVAMFIWTAFGGNVVKGLVMAVIVWAAPGMILWFIQRNLRQVSLELETMAATFDENSRDKRLPPS